MHFASLTLEGLIFFLIFKHFSVSRIKQIQIFKDMSIDQSEH